MALALAILPNFVLIALGFLLSRRFDYGRDFWEGLEKLVYYVLFPALLFRSLAVAQLDFSRTGLLLALACAFTVAGMLLALPVGRLFKLERAVSASGFQCAFRFNTYIGLALAGSLFGQPAVAAAAILLGVMIPLVNLAAVAMLASGSDRGFLRELVRNPLIISTVTGFAWNVAGLPLPAFADHTLNLLAQTALPAGLLSVGAALRIERGDGHAGAHAYWLTVKLVALPLIALGLVRAFALTGVDAAVLVLLASLPTASSAYILAARMGADGRTAATQITVGTLLSMATIPFWMALL
ncbi:AEC family transporter [Usitatibacter palustris]|uniref:AEC family transporter n=1 Tax=Usitatibacter palustris TaxID=2732487 RepID=A0A6M4HF11_9PROT|nr:AEC family transporter [Usitatibacter palustris]QJR16627.1 hypothetical protein DSM104440_03462 [Usitatibacter palustris]